MAYQKPKTFQQLQICTTKLTQILLWNSPVSSILLEAIFGITLSPVDNTFPLEQYYSRFSFNEISLQVDTTKFNEILFH